jgi:tetratricopeptide (TPR) repeat protein
VQTPSDKMLSWFFFGCLLSGSVLLAANAARADAKQDARDHFEAGVAASQQERFADAATEFERAYELEPAWQVLYNLGAVYAALGRPVEAVDAFERYLDQADASVDAERRRQVHVEIDKQRAKTGWLDLRVNETGAEVRIDAQAVGVTPLPAALLLAAGAHSIEVSREGQRLEQREALVTAGRKTVIDVNLVPIAERSIVAPVGTSAVQPSPSHAAADSDTGTTQRIIGWSLGGVGLVGVVIGSVVAAKGQMKHLDAVDLAKNGERSKAEEYESEADRQKTLGFATLGVSGAVFIAGVIVLLSAPSASRATAAALQVSGWASASSSGVIVRRNW